MGQQSSKRAVLITGVTRGLGRAMVEGFVAAGHTVFGCGRSAEGIAELQKAYGASHDFQALDVADDTAVKRWAAAVLPKFGTPNLLLNNAALMNQTRPLWEVPADEFSQMIDVNIKGVVNVIRHFAPAMIARKSGVIVNFSSGWGRSTSPEVAPYCATKWAIEGLTLALAQELPQGMAAVPLSPGVIDTDMLRKCWGSDASAYPSPEEWAQRAVPFLLKLGEKDNGRQLSVG